jgi:CBS domain-containing protein
MRVNPSEGRARQWMTAEPVTVSPETPVSAAARLARECGICHIPVVEDDRVVGMLLVEDALRQTAVPIGLGF